MKTTDMVKLPTTALYAEARKLRGQAEDAAATDLGLSGYLASQAQDIEDEIASRA